MKRGNLSNNNKITEPHQNLTQNNINVYQTVVKDLHGLSADKQDRILALLEEVTKHNMEIEKSIIEIEKQNLLNSTDEIPHIRNYSFRGQTLAFVTVVGSLLSAVLFGFMGMENAAVASIIVLGGTVAVNFLNKK